MFAPSPAPRAPVPLSTPVGVALGLPAGAAAALLAWTLGGAVPTGLVLAAVAAGWVAALTPPLGALAATVQIWACLDGFVIHRFGTLDAGPRDLAAAGVVAAVALVAQLAAALTRRHRTIARPPGYAPVEIVGVSIHAARTADRA